MNASLLALGAAAAYGLADFTGGFATRRRSAWAVAGWSQVIGVVALAIGVVVVPATEVRPIDLIAGGIAGEAGVTTAVAVGVADKAAFADAVAVDITGGAASLLHPVLLQELLAFGAIVTRGPAAPSSLCAPVLLFLTPHR